MRKRKITDRGTEGWVKRKMQNYDQSYAFKIDTTEETSQLGRGTLLARERFDRVGIVPIKEEIRNLRRPKGTRVCSSPVQQLGKKHDLCWSQLS